MSLNDIRQPDEARKAPLTELYTAAPADAAACAHIQTASWAAAFKGIIPDAELERACNESRALAMYERVLTRGDMHGLVLAVDGAPHCIAFWGKSRDAATAGSAELICIHSLPANWRRGYGTLMMSSVLEAMRAAGYERAVLWVFEANTRARRFYEKCGWALVGASRQELGACAVQYRKELKIT